MSSSARTPASRRASISRRSTGRTASASTGSTRTTAAAPRSPGAGDVNGDGIDDLIVGAPEPTDGTVAGESYVVFGTDTGFAASLDLSALDGSNGFRLDGIDAYDYSGRSVAGAGDVNGDGFDDLIVGAPGADGRMPARATSSSASARASRRRRSSAARAATSLPAPMRASRSIPAAGSTSSPPAAGPTRSSSTTWRGKRDVLTIADFDPLADTLDLRGAAVAETLESETRTVLLLDGPDRDTIVLLGLSDSPLDLI